MNPEVSACQYKRGDIDPASPKPDECQFFTDPYVLNKRLPSKEHYQCLILHRKSWEVDVTEIRPMLVDNELESSLPDEPWPRNVTHKTTRLTYSLSFHYLAMLGARRITIGGLFFGPDTNGYLDAEACVENY